MASTKGTDLRLQVERTVKSPPARTYRAWTEPDQLKRWFAPSEEMTIEAEVDLRVGGGYRIAMGPYVVQGVYHEVVPDRRLVFSWQWQGEAPSNEMVVTVEFLEHGDGSKLLITHERLATPEARDQHDEGWTAILARLDDFLASE